MTMISLPKCSTCGESYPMHTMHSANDCVVYLKSRIEELEAENKRLRDLRIKKGIDNDCIHHTGLADAEEPTND